MSFFKALGNFWVKTFDYKGESSRKEFWAGILQIVVLLFVMLGFGYYLCGFENFESKYLLIFSLVYWGIVVLPYISLIIRRLWDIGFTGLGIFIVFILIFPTAGIMIFIVGLLPTNSFVLNQSNILHKLVRSK